MLTSTDNFTNCFAHSNANSDHDKDTGGLQDSNNQWQPQYVANMIKDIEIKNISHHNNLIIGVFVVMLLTIWNLYHTSYVSLQDRMETMKDKYDQAYTGLLAKSGNDYNFLQNKYNDLDKKIYKIEMELESLTSPIHTLTSSPSTPTK